MELLLNFHIGFIGKWGSQKKVFIDGKAVAWYYITHGQFFVDVLTAVAWIAQVTPIPRKLSLFPFMAAEHKCA